MAKINELGGPEHAKNLDQKDRDVLTKRLNTTHNHVHTAPHACPLGVLHDTRHVLSSVAKEVRTRSFT
jgi:hypothetical protein